jgi:IMP dehydrogenase
MIDLDITNSLTFDDLLLRPKYSEIESRSTIDVGVKLSKSIELKTPIIPANMKTVVGYEMCKAMYQAGTMSIVHRFMSVGDQVAIPIKLAQELGSDVWNFVGLSVGVKEEDKAAVDHFAKEGAKILVIDVAHGHSKACVDMCQYISTKHPNVFLIAGNVATMQGALALFRAGADAVKVGIGGGGICSTRVQTGNGVPQITALQEAVWARNQYIRANEGTNPRKLFVISDGGIRHSGDIVKALALGADLVMCGGLFAGTDETPSEIVVEGDETYKRYNGSSTLKDNHIEGVKALVPCKGPVKEMLQGLLEGIKSGCSYQGAHNLEELRKNPQFIKLTPSGIRESYPHDVLVVQ